MSSQKDIGAIIPSLEKINLINIAAYYKKDRDTWKAKARALSEQINSETDFSKQDIFKENVSTTENNDVPLSKKYNDFTSIKTYTATNENSLYSNLSTLDSIFKGKRYKKFIHQFNEAVDDVAQHIVDINCVDYSYLNPVMQNKTPYESFELDRICFERKLFEQHAPQTWNEWETLMKALDSYVKNNGSILFNSNLEKKREFYNQFKKTTKKIELLTERAKDLKLIPSNSYITTSRFNFRQFIFMIDYNFSEGIKEEILLEVPSKIYFVCAMYLTTLIEYANGNYKKIKFSDNLMRELISLKMTENYEQTKANT